MMLIPQLHARRLHNARRDRLFGERNRSYMYVHTVLR